MIDESFIGRVYGTSAIVWACGVAIAWGLGGTDAAAGWTLGSGLSLGTLRSLEWIVRRSFVPKSLNAQRSLAKFSLAKLAILALVLSGIVIVEGRSLALVLGLCAGVVLTQTIVVLKVLGMLINQRMNG